MKRFYTASIEALKAKGLQELAADIDSYVNLLELQKAALISEMVRPPLCVGEEILLRDLGYKIKTNSQPTNRSE